MPREQHVGRIERLLAFRWPLIVALFAFLPFSLTAAWQSWLSNSNNVEDWLPIDKQLTEFVGLFGSDELLMISWEGCTLEDPRIEAYAEALQQPVDGGDAYFRDAITGPEILEFFESEPLEMERDEARRRMRGWIVSADDATTCVIALVSAAGAADRHAAVEFARSAADGVDGLEPASIRMAGPTIEGVAIDKASKEGLLELNLYSYIICLVILVVCLKNFRAALLVFLMALFNEQLSLALIHYLGSNLDSILLLTANLTFVLTISVGVHLVNYYRDALAEVEGTLAPAIALNVALRPTLVATATTALGLVSLGISEVLPLSRFGLFSALSILVGTVVVMVYVPIHFRIWPLPKRGSSEDQDHALASSNEVSRLGWLQQLAIPLLLVVAATLVVGVVGAQKLQTAVGLRELVSPQLKSSQDFVWLEDNIGPLVPVELVLELPAGNAHELLAQFRVVHQLHESLAALDARYAVISSATLSPEPPPPGGGFRQLARAAAFRKQLVRNQEELSDLGYLRSTDDSNFWRVTLRAPSMQDVNYGALLAEAQAVVDTVLAENEKLEPKQVLVCGGIPLIYNVQQKLLEDLIASFLLAFSLVSLALMILFRSVWCGLVCMIPNLLPSAIVFGWMGWLGWSVEVGTVLTASAALGIAVDDSLHFITWFQRALQAGKTIPQAVGNAYHRCGAAMIQTTLVCGLGLLVFAGSGFSPISRFGWCMFTLLFLALVADLVVLPAILLSPLGRLFVPKTREVAEVHSLDVAGTLRKASLAVAAVSCCLIAQPAIAQEQAVQRDELVRLLPADVLTVICVSDFSEAVAEQTEFQDKGNGDKWGDFDQQFKIAPQELAKVVEGPLIRASVLHDSNEEELILAYVDEEEAAALGLRVRRGVFCSATNEGLLQEIGKRIEETPASETPPLLREFEEFGLRADTHLSLQAYANPWLKDRQLAKQDANSPAARRYRDAQRHGLTSVASIVSGVAIEERKAQRAATRCRVEGKWNSTLGMLGHLQPLESTDLADWIPRQVESVMLLNMDLPQAFKHIGAVFDDGFAEGVEGTYRDLLADIKLGIEIDLEADLYADFMQKAYIVYGQPSEERPQGFAIAVHTAAPAKAANVVFKLMEGDDQKEVVEVPGSEYPLYHVPPQSTGGEDFVMMVAHRFLFYSNDIRLMHQILEATPDESLNTDPMVNKSLRQATAGSDEKPSLLVVRGATTDSPSAEGPKQASLWRPLFQGTQQKSTQPDVPTNQMFSVIMPATESFDCTVGYLVENGMRFVSTTHSKEQP